MTTLTKNDERIDRRTDLRLAIRDTIPVAMGYLPLGMAYGVLLTHSGIPWYWAPISCILVFAGSMQLVWISLCSAAVALPQIALATLVVNFRHVFYGLSFPLNLLEGPLRRGYGVFALTDETYSLVATKESSELSGGRITFIQLLSHGYWTIGSTLGAIAAFAVPKHLRGLEFALTALFVVLAQEAIYTQRNLRSPVLGLTASLAALMLAGQNSFLAFAIAIFLVLMAACYVLPKLRWR